MTMEKVYENLNEIQAKISDLIKMKGAPNGEVEIIGASKFRPIETLRRLSEQGVVKVFGENKVQEFNSKYDENLTWDIIGQLQTNKVKYVVGKVRYISSLDRLALADEIEKVATKKGVVQKCLVEVNSGEEECKGGISIDEIDEFLEKLDGYSHIEICGIMAVAPQGIGDDELKNCFLKVNKKFVEIKSRRSNFTVLSMGMSEDFLLAIECGSNQVRLGRVLFGDRPQVL